VFAVADIGSNTVHLLVGKFHAAKIIRVVNESDWLSLGKIVARSGIVPAPTVQKLIAILERYKDLAESNNAAPLRVFATEAMRLAENREDVLREILENTGCQVDIISPERETKLSLRGARLDAHPDGAYLFVEVGGGSTQVAECKEDQILRQVSLPLGTGQLIAKCGLQAPCDEQQLESMTQYINDSIEPLNAFGDVGACVASGGIARGLVRALHPDAEMVLHEQELEYLAWSAAKLQISKIVTRFRVKTQRAGTLVPGSHVILAILQHFHLDHMLVSRFGIREGAILELSAEG